MESFFKLKERGTTVQTEIMAGITTFMTMAYILAVNPSILADAGMDKGAVFTATALASGIACVLMALLANLPFALSAGMGLNAYLAYTVVIGMGYSWETALTAVFVEGLIFIILSLTNVREAIFNAIPTTLKVGVSVGIGLFICFIGLQNAHIVIGSTTLVGLFPFGDSIREGIFRSEGLPVLLALIGTLVTAFLVIKRIRGNILIGIVITWAMGILCELVGFYVPNPEAGFYTLIPSGVFSAPASLAPTFMKLDFSNVFTLNFFSVIFAFLFVDLFDTLGTLIGCASRANMLDEQGRLPNIRGALLEQGRLPNIRGALLADAIGTTAGACLGTSTVTTFVESSSGIAEGGRTGLTAITTGFFFLLSLFFAPLFLAIPSFATAPALIIVGFLMMQQVVKIEWHDPVEAIPAYIAIFAMPFMYSISEGISMGIISYVVLHVLTGKTKDMSPLMYLLAVLFVLKYILL